MLPNKKLGQNFLIDDSHLIAIADKSVKSSDAIVLEIGAGLGALTRELASRVEKVVAVEIDRGIFPLLKGNLADYDNVTFVLGDILKLDIGEIIPAREYSVIANIPYYLTSKLIRYLLESPAGPSRISLLVQKEVAQRACLVAPKMNLLALSIQVFGSAEIVHKVPSGAFFPVPKVDSALLQIEIYKTPRFEVDERKHIFRIAKAAFQQKRKTIANSLSSLQDWSKEEIILLLTGAEIDPGRRPQTLSLNEWTVISHFNQK